MRPPWNFPFSTTPKSHFRMIKRPIWVKSVMRPLETSLSQLHPSPILGWSRGRKWVRRAWRPFETSLSRQYQNRILGFSRGWKWLLSAIRTPESRLYQLEKVTFLVDQDADNYFKVTSQLKSLLFDFIQIAFWASPEAQNKLRVTCEPLKHHFFNHRKSNFWLAKKPNNIQSDMRLFKTSHFRLHTGRILGWSRGSIWVTRWLETT